MLLYFALQPNRTRQDLGWCIPLACQKCNQLTYWKLLREYDTSFFGGTHAAMQYFIGCDVCGHMAPLDPDQSNRAQYLQTCTYAYFETRMTEDQYKQCLESVKWLHKQEWK